MMTVKDVVGRVASFLAEAYAGKPILDLRLEEIELSDDRPYWYVTVSFELYENEPASQLRVGNRLYKVLEIDAASGQVRSMKIRELKTA